MIGRAEWVVENVKPYYQPLIEPTTVIQRHYFWSNYEIKQTEFKKDKIRTAQIPQLQKQHGFNLDGYNIKGKRQVLRNCVLPELGKHIFDQVIYYKERKYG